MQIKRLEAYGFKSFADKIQMELTGGITAVVGPNGSGKSNITDAIRWVLGEQNARNLRARTAEDVIFTGSASRKPLGFAEVTLTFDNDGGLPVDYNEVVITRRLFRSGESEYFLNMTRCRLKDIYDLFADTGIGHSGMSIIGQNRIDAILNSKPEERRAFFEETAGITKYKSRKKESLRKLEETETHLVRIGDIIREIETDLAPLEKSAEKTQKYNELKERYQKCNLTLLSAKYEKLSGDATANNELLTAAKDKAAGIETDSKTAEAKHEALMKYVVDLEKKHQEQSRIIDELREKSAATSGEMAALNEREEQSAAAKENILARRRGLNAKLAAEIATIGKFAEEKAALDKELAAVEELLTQRRQNIAEVKEKLAAEQETQRQLAAKTETSRQKSADIEKELALTEQEIAGFAEGLSHSETAIAALEEEIKNLADEKKRVADETKNLQEKERAAHEERDKIRQELNGRRAELDRAAHEEMNSRGQINNARNKLQFLLRMQESYEGFGKGAKAVLKSTAPWRGDIVGAVAEIIDVPEKYVVAAEIALGANLQNIVTKNDAAAKAAIGFLKSNRLGRVTFLPLNTLTLRQNREQIRATGFIGYLNDLVTTKDEYKIVADFLLSRTAVADTLDNALAIAKTYGYRLRIVTLDGDLVNPGGSMTGGSIRAKETGFLGRESEIESLKKAVETHERHEEQWQQARKEAAERLRDGESRLADINGHLQELLLKKAECNAALKRATELFDEKRVNLLTAQKNMQQSENHGDELREKKSALAKEQEDLAKELHAFDEQATTTEQNIAALSREAQMATAAVGSDEITMARLEEKVKNSAENLRLHREAKNEEENNLKNNEREEHDLAKNLELAKKRLEELRREYEEQQKHLLEAAALRDKISAERVEKLNAAQYAEKLVRDASRRLSDAQNAVHKLELAASKINFGLEECAETMLAEYGLTPPRAKEEALDEPIEDVKKAADELDGAIKDLGAINPNAPAEYKEKKNRHEFMAKQSADLTAAKEDLLTLIDEMNDTMTSQFKEAFKKIQEYFDEIFVRLFGGGKAELKLLDETDILNTGIEIIVQLPQKKRQSLAALSGGERALTVIALLFSFLKYKPSPFSVLDEIDAPLDEANVLRFGAFLKEFSANTQFIVVTHRKGTMESADTMYGVTVEDTGVSKIISVKLDEV